uniref:Uncharacterized protein n=1 Tax=Oxytricha trifallax TaxID=1172189 RepID=G9HRC0_9SPIT|nr:hypothetical protein [Oxytricha trifallax]
MNYMCIYKIYFINHFFSSRPLVLSWIFVKLIKKEEITLKIKTKWASDLKYILKLIFIYQPVTIVFKATYSFLKLIKNKQKNIFYSKTLYNLILATVMGFHLWFIDLVNRLENNIQDLNDTKLMHKKKFKYDFIYF